MNLYIARHAESLANANSDTYRRVPSYKIMLSQYGELQAERMGEAINLLLPELWDPLKIYISPYKRTMDTWEHMKPICCKARQSAKVIQEPLISEQGFGMLGDSHMSAEDMMNRDGFGHFYYQNRDGESGLDVYVRVTLFLNKLKDLSCINKNVIVITHGEVAKICDMILMQRTVKEYEKKSDWKNGEIRKYNIYPFLNFQQTATLEETIIV